MRDGGVEHGTSKLFVGHSMTFRRRETENTTMNTNLEIFYNVFVSILFWLTALIALWISGRIIRRNLIRVDRSTQLFLWLVLGGFFRIPLVDLLSALGTLIAQTIPFTSGLSELSGRPDITVSIMKLLIYAFAIYYGQRV